MVDSQSLKAKNTEAADETRTFEKGQVNIVHVDEVTAGMFTLEPGWKWSESDIRMTLAIYTHATDGMQDAATDALEEAFS
jgi:hypothetical protein